MNNSRFRQLAAFILAGAVAGYAAQVSAAGFAVNTPSAQHMGNAVAGGGAIAEDASAVWMNPASITRLPSQAMTSAHVLLPSFEFTDKGSTQAAVGPFPSFALSGPATTSGDKEALVANFYYIRKLDERLSFGLAVNAPFGLATEYDRNWKGRYHAVESEILDFNINPALAWKVNDVFSVGAGVSVNYVDAKINNAVDFGTICVPAANCGGGTSGPGTADGFAEHEADDLSYGFNFGFFYEPNNRSRFSLAYRSQINHKLEGDVDFTVPAAAVPFVGASFTDGGVKAGVSLPDSLSLSAFHMVTPKTGIMGDITWTGWSDVPELRIIYDDGVATGDGFAVEPLGWQDVWRFSFGVNYYQTDRLTLRTGVAYDQSPVPNPVLATPRVPDNDRIWFSIGASYTASDKLSVDFAYTHEFLDDSNIARPTETGATLLGSYESSVDIISLQLSYLFD